MRLANRFILIGLALIAGLSSSAQYVQPMRYDHYSIPQQVNIGSGVVRVTAPSAYLEIGPTSGATKGLLGPRLTSTERDAISSPADGLLIYNTTTKKYQYYDGGSSSWKDLGSGAVGGSGITQLGTSPWGLTKLNDSTYVVDSMKVLTKYQGEKTRDSLAVLINLKLAKSDSLTGGNPTGFVTKTILNDSLLTRLKTAQALPFDTTGAETGDALIIDRTGGDTIKTAPFPTGGGTGSGAFSKLEWFTGDENAPAIGDSILVHDSFPGKYLDVYRNGIKQPQVYNDTGFYRLTDSSFKVKPYFAANEFWHIEARDSSAYTQLTLQGLPPPGATWTDLTFTTTNGWFTNTAGVWSSGAGSFGGYGLESGSFTGEVWVKQQRADASAALGILGFNESNTNEGNAGYEFSSYFDQTGVITYLDNGSGTTVGYTLATGSWMALHRAASGTVTIETSADGLTGWTVRYTFTPTSTATFYINMNVHSATYKCHYPQVYY